MCYNGHRAVLVQAVLHPNISIDGRCTCVFGGVGTKLDIKLCNDYFLACNEITAGSRTPRHCLNIWVQQAACTGHFLVTDYEIKYVEYFRGSLNNF
jgi:hypothetical protein